MKTQLTDRVLRFDGVSEVVPDQLVKFLLLGIPPAKLRVTEETEDVRTFNAQVSAEESICIVGDALVGADLDWKLPETYRQLDIDAYIGEALGAKQVELGYTAALAAASTCRVAVELEEVKARNLEPLIRTIIYVLDQFKLHQVVWGVGRGSSCASYLLFLLGLHAVDCVVLEVSMEEFFHS